MWINEQKPDGTFSVNGTGRYGTQYDIKEMPPGLAGTIGYGGKGDDRKNQWEATIYRTGNDRPGETVDTLGPAESPAAALELVKAYLRYSSTPEPQPDKSDHPQTSQDESPEAS